MTRETQPEILRSVRVGRCQIAYLKFLLEAHEGLATPTTRDGEPDVVDLIVAPDFEADLDELLTALAEEITVERVAPPERSPL
ncbi:MAG: DUF4911 domain-containing protein [Deltaproteobacteria bacterium]|nr:DUF4911 domain-containing protein [Deltaproteobacteria bacterium]